MESGYERPSWMQTKVTKTCGRCGTPAVIQVVSGTKWSRSLLKDVPNIVHQCQAVRDGRRCKWEWAARD